jgi:hypothetical protein
MFWTWETAIVVVAFAAAAIYAARPEHRWRIEMVIRAFREDVRRAMRIRRGEPPAFEIIDRYEFDDGSDDNGVMVLKTGMRLRFETFGVSQDEDVWKMAWRSVPLGSDGQPDGDPFETFMELREAPDGTAVKLEYAFYKGERTGFKVWLSRLLSF